MEKLRNPIEDNEAFQTKYGFDQEPMTPEKLEFRMSLLLEEFQESMAAYMQHNAEELVDGHIDLIVIALGNLYLAGIDVNQAWSEVFEKNMQKIRGVKPGRDNSNGFDVRKPTQKDVDEGLTDKVWESPNHSNNVGILKEILHD